MRISDWSSDVCSSDLIAPPSGELYANPAASQAMLDDAMFNVEDWLADEIAREFAVAEGTAFVGGNGTNRPKGFLSYAATEEDDAARDFGTLQYVASGAAGGFAAARPQDRSDAHRSELQSPKRISYAVYCLQKKKLSARQ